VFVQLGAVHGVGETLPGLSDFVGSRLRDVAYRENIVYFTFLGAGESELAIGVEGSWFILDTSGVVVTNGEPLASNGIPSPPLGDIVVAAETQPAEFIVLRFMSGHRLCVVDSSDQYESFSIPHAGVHI
jgi:hypothetical protein